MILRISKILLTIFFSWASLTSWSQCSKYQLYASDSVGCENDILSFYVLPKPPSGAVLNWDFGFKKANGTNKPLIAYTNKGTFDVSLEMTLPGSVVCNLERKSYIRIGTRPVITSVTASSPIVCGIGKKVSITGKADDVKTWTWTIGNTTYQNASNTVSHTFTRPGYTTVQVIAKSNLGCEGKRILDSVVFVERQPDVKFGFKDTTLCGSSTINLNPEYTYYGNNDFEYEWDFQGAKPETSSLADPLRIEYSNKGTYDVSLKMSSNASICVFDYTFDDLVSVADAPDIKLKTTPLNGDGCKSRVYALKLQPEGLDYSGVKWFHNYGPDTLNIDVIGDDSAVVSGITGSFRVWALYPAANCDKYVFADLVLESNAILADFEKDLPCICSVPRNVSIKNLSTSKNTNLLTYEWEVKNANDKVFATSTQKDLDWTVSAYGQYTVTMIATDENGCSERTSYEVRSRPLDIQYAASPYESCPGTEVTLQLDDTMCYDEIDSIVWTLYELDGSTIKLEEVNQDMSISEVYNDTGYYDAQVVMTTEEGCVDTLRRDSVLHITELKSISVEVPTGPFCTGDIIPVRFSINPENLDGEWHGYLIGDRDIDTAEVLDELVFRPLIAGTYDVKVVFISDECQDSIILKDAVQVGGVVFGLSAKERKGCLPLTTTLESTILENVLVSSTDTKLLYTWELDPSHKGTIANPSSPSTQVTIEGAGTTDVSLTVENSEGCKSRLTRFDMFDFDLYVDFDLNQKFCAGVPLEPYTLATGRFDTFLWSANSPQVRFEPSDTSYSPTIHFDAPGIYEIKLYARDVDGCEAEQVRETEVISFDFDFSVEDNVAKCSPASFKFVATGNGVDSFVWDFGDGEPRVTTEDEEYVKIFDLTRVKPYKNLFDIKLIAKTSFGCVDSMEVADLINVRGPVPIFEFENNIGCDPVEVTFLNKSINTTKVFFDYGDDASIDSVNFDSHTYTAPDTSEYTVFRPFIVVHDAFDCKYSYFPEDSIVVYSYPKVDIKVSDTVGCDPFTVSFSDRSTYARNWRWIFGDADAGSQGDSLASYTYSPGTYGAFLIVENAVGCTDTSDIQRITALERPEANFTIDDSINCVGKDVQFVDSSTTKVGLKSWRWDFGDNLVTDDTSRTKSPKFRYDSEGVFNVELIVTDINGCKDTIVKDGIVKIYNQLPIDGQSMNYVSVWNDTRIELEFPAAPRFAFSKYDLIETTSSRTILSTRGHSDTSHLLAGFIPDDQPYCFQVILTDKCDDVHPSDTHCTIHAQTDPNQTEITHLSWTPYVGWDDLSNYVIYRGIVGQSLFSIDTVPKEELTYIDSSVCAEDYVYAVIATRARDSIESWSNHDEFSPQYVFQTDPLEFYLATVKDGDVLLHWERSFQRNVKHYAIDRRSSEGRWVEDWRLATDTFFVDSFSRTSDVYYQYRLKVVDDCDYRSELSNLATSILLEAEPTQRDFQLSWNTYLKWPSGVKEYILERKAEAETEFNRLAVFTSLDSIFLDTSAFLIFERPFTYRVKAVENSSPADTSYSNELIVNPIPTIFLANAFTPDDDGMNDIFNLKGGALVRDSINPETFEFRVYNRWGERVFKTNDIDEGWDGTFKGQPCPPESYIYLLNAQGLDGTLFFKRGGIVLIR